MTSTQTLLRASALALLAGGLVAQAATVTGTVTNKTTNKPAAGDAVVLVDVQAGMGEVARSTTDSNGHYSLNEPGTSSYLVRAAHQGATYFIGAPQNGAPGDITVYDSAPKVDGIAISADVLEFETTAGQLQVNERYFVHNNSNPPKTQFSPKGFEIVLPTDAVLDSSSASRPGGLPTNVQMQPTGEKGHYTISIPIQPNQGEKETVFDLRYHLPYKDNKYSFNIKELLLADNVAVLLPKSMTFTAGSGVNFQQVQEDPGILTYIAKRTPAGQAIAFTISGTGNVPREDQNAQQMGGDTTGSTNSQAGGQPGGGMAPPNGTPDPLSKYKWWILGTLALLLAAAAAFLLRKPADAAPAFAATALPADRNAAVLQVLKDEIFALESEKIAETISAEEYEKVKAALETVLKRALKKS